MPNGVNPAGMTTVEKRWSPKIRVESDMKGAANKPPIDHQHVSAAAAAANSSEFAGTGFVNLHTAGQAVDSSS